MNEFDRLLLELTSWVKGEEKRVLKEGKKLNKCQVQEAKKIGIKEYKKVRILYASEIMLPYDLDLIKLLTILNLIPQRLNGLAVGHGIILQNDLKDDRELLLHELTHVRQFEASGGFESFLRGYIIECINGGYDRSSFELEANRNLKPLIPFR